MGAITAMRDQVRAAWPAALSDGLGSEARHCAMAAVAWTLEGRLSDHPTCVHEVDRAFIVALNDARWSSDEARAAGMMPLALASLGTAGTNRVAWVRALAEGTIRRVVPIALRAAASLAAPEHAAALEAAAVRCEAEGSVEAAAYAAYAARAAADASAYAAASGDAVLLVAVDVALQAYGVAS